MSKPASPAAPSAPLPPLAHINRPKTHRLIPAKFADGGDSVLARLTSSGTLLEGIFELDSATNERLLAELGKAPGIDPRELAYGIPLASIVNAAYCHPSPRGGRFNSSERGCWYAAFELRTSQAEVIYHRRFWLQETAWEDEDIADYVDYFAAFHEDFHDLRGNSLRKNSGSDIEDGAAEESAAEEPAKAEDFSVYLDPDSYTASQTLAARLLQSGSPGIVYPSVRRSGGTCIACFRPALVTRVRRDATIRLTFHGWKAPVRIEKL